MKIRVPKRFKIMDDTVQVKLIKGYLKQTGALGHADTRKKEIRIDDDPENSSIVQTFMHELLEYCLVETDGYVKKAFEDHGYHLTHKDVDIVSRMIRQALESAEY